MTDRVAGQPLKGIRVLDLTTWWAGPLATMILADMGAEVIKIEAIQRLDNWRSTLADYSAEAWWETSPLFNAVNRNKYGLTLNLSSPEGNRLFKALVEISDVVFENYSRRVMPNFGLSYDVLKRLNPRLIMVSQTGFGQHGPWCDYVSFANVAESLAGVANLTGHADGPPCISGQMLGDTLSGMHAAYAALLALRERERTGCGQYIDLSQHEASLPVAAEALADQQMNGRSWSRAGNRHPHMAPHGCFPVRGDDRWVVIAVVGDQEWSALAECLKEDGREWAAESTWAAAQGRKAGEDLLDERVAEWTRCQDRETLVARLRERGVAAAPVLSPSEMLHEPHLQARGFFASVAREPVGELPYPGSPLRFSKGGFQVGKPAPLLGEDNEYVLRGLLKLSEEEIRRLEREQIVGKVPAALLD